MSPAPGSLLWLLRHELKLQWRSSGSKLKGIVALILVLAAFHLFALFLALAFTHMPAIPRQVVLVGVTGACLVTFLLMLSMGLVAAMQAIYERGDMTLLLTAPIDPRSIMFVRMGALALNLGLGSCALILPFANMFAIFVTPTWLFAYAAVPALALVASSASLISALGLFRLLGARRARVFAQILGAFVGIAAGIVGQLPNLMSSESKTAAGHWFTDVVAGLPASDSWLWLPARAFTGDVALLLVVVVAACALAALTVVGLADRFIASATAAGGEARSAHKRTGKTRAFRTGTVSVMRRKELRLLGRDPWLLTQVGQQLVYVAPTLLLIWQKSDSTFGWLMFVFVAGMLGSALAWLTISGEDAPDLLAAAPIPPSSALRAKLEAALLPIVLALLIPAFFAARIDSWLGVTVLVCGTASAASGALLQLSCSSPGKRSEFAKRYKGRIVMGFVEMTLAAMWGLVAFLMLRHTLWALLPLSLVVFPLGIRLYSRIERHPPVLMPARAVAA
jgi:ABC-2 type transport system permease protein